MKQRIAKFFSCSKTGYIVETTLGILSTISAVVLFDLKYINESWLSGILLVGFIFIIVGCINNDKYVKNQQRICFLNVEMYINQETKRHREIGTSKATVKNSDFDAWKKTIIDEVYKKYTDSYKSELYKSLLRERKDCEVNSDVMKTIVLPAEIGLVSFFSDNYGDFFGLIGITVLTLVMVILLIVEVSDSENRIAFIDDFISAIDEYEETEKIRTQIKNN